MIGEIIRLRQSPSTDNGQTDQKNSIIQETEEDLTRPHHLLGSCRSYMEITPAQKRCVQPLKHTTGAQLSCKLHDKLMIFDDHQSSF